MSKSSVTFPTSKRLLLLRRVATTDRRSARQIVDAIESLEGTATSAGHRIAIVIATSPAPSARGIDLSLYPLPPRRNSGTFRHLDFGSGHGESGARLTKCVGGLLNIMAHNLHVQLGFILSTAPAEAAVCSNGDQSVSRDFGLIWLGDFYAEGGRELLAEKDQSVQENEKSYYLVTENRDIRCREKKQAT
nr:uncharacterized protein LOC109168481 isoform X1 [Ipomoea trifida]